MPDSIKFIQMPKRQRTCGLSPLQRLAALLAHHRVDVDRVLCQWGEALENHSGLGSINKHLEESGGQRVCAEEVKKLDYVSDNVLKVFFLSVCQMHVVLQPCKKTNVIIEGLAVHVHNSQKLT